MVRAGGIIIHVAAARRGPLLEAFDMYGRVAEVVPEFAHSRNAPLVAFLCFDDGKVTHLARARRGMRAAHELSRLNLDDMTKLPKPVAISDIVGAVPLRIRRHAEARLTGGGLLSPTSFTAVVDAVRGLSDASRPLLDRFSVTRRVRIARLGTEAGSPSKRNPSRPLWRSPGLSGTNSRSGSRRMARLPALSWTGCRRPECGRTR